MTAAPHHSPVLLKEVLSFMSGTRARRLLDATVGYGGHSEALLRLFPDAQLLGLDRDTDALKAATQRLKPYSDRASLVHCPFSEMTLAADELQWDAVDGILMDIGVSSPQLDTPQRGFSFREDGPLDMRMDRRQHLTAATLLNQRSEEELADIFFRFGEERRARQVARAVVARREEKPWARTSEFAELVEAVVGRGARRTFHPATRCFQALRIAVNNELGELEDALEQAVQLLEPGGRIVVITFHSLEDRIVKHFFRNQASPCICPPDLPRCVCGKVPTLTVLTRKPVRPTEEEVQQNRRAAPAKLRVAERISQNTIDS